MSLASKIRDLPWGCVMIRADLPSLLDAVARVDPQLWFSSDSHRHVKGLVPKSKHHVTLHYGIAVFPRAYVNALEWRSKVQTVCFRMEVPDSVPAKDLHIFDCGEYFAVVLRLKDPGNKLLHCKQKLLAEFPCYNEHPDYVPHVTIGYTETRSAAEQVIAQMRDEPGFPLELEGLAIFLGETWIDENGAVEAVNKLYSE